MRPFATRRLQAPEPLREATSDLLSISAVLPAHNEEGIIERTVATCVAMLSRLTEDYEVIIVDDGSTDRTGGIVDGLAARHDVIRVLHNRPQRGYGGALIRGFEAASKKLLFFMDSDGQFDVSDIRELLGAHGQGWQAVLGYRRSRRDSVPRLINGWGWNRLIALLYGLKVHDVDCGFKLYETALVHSLDVRAEGATVNVEMLLKLARLGVAFAQVPVSHYVRTSGRASGADPKVIVRALFDLLHLARRVESWDERQRRILTEVILSDQEPMLVKQ